MLVVFVWRALFIFSDGFTDGERACQQDKAPSTVPPHQELKSEKPLCYCADSIARHGCLVPSSSLA